MILEKQDIDLTESAFNEMLAGTVSESDFAEMWDEKPSQYCNDIAEKLSSESLDVPLNKSDFEFISQYDVNDKRIEKITRSYNSNTGNWEISKTRRYVYDGWNLLAEFDENHNMVKSYVWGQDISGTEQGAGGIGGLLAVNDEESSKTYYSFNDGRGNVKGYVDSEDASVVAAYDYGPFGEDIESVGELKDYFCHRFSSKFCDAESGLYYFGYRSYSPKEMKFISRDPLQESGGINMYGYCYNNPNKYFEYLGAAAYFFGGTNNSLEKGHWSNVEAVYFAWNTRLNGRRHYVPGVFSGLTADSKKKPKWYKTWNPAFMLDRGVENAFEGGRGYTTDLRVEEMLKKLETELAAGDKEVNLFAFSRGTLAAMEFLNQVNERMKDPKKSSLYSGIKFNTVIVWDQVKSAPSKYRHDLPKGMKFVHQPVHFISIDERRADFFDKEVLDIQGAIQIGVRGNHAEGGGGYKGAFSWTSLSTVEYLGLLAGLNLNEKILKSHYGKKDWTEENRDNSKWFYAGDWFGYGFRKFPKDMYLHSSVKNFNKHTIPKNNISGHKELPDSVWYRW